MNPGLRPVDLRNQLHSTPPLGERQLQTLDVAGDSLLPPRDAQQLAVEAHIPTPLHKVALVVDEKTGKTSRVGYSKSAEDGNRGKVRVAIQAKNKEIK